MKQFPMRPRVSWASPEARRNAGFGSTGSRTGSVCTLLLLTLMLPSQQFQEKDQMDVGRPCTCWTSLCCLCVCCYSPTGETSDSVSSFRESPSQGDSHGHNFLSLSLDSSSEQLSCSEIPGTGVGLCRMDFKEAIELFVSRGKRQCRLPT